MCTEDAFSVPFILSWFLAILNSVAKFQNGEHAKIFAGTLSAVRRTLSIYRSIFLARTFSLLELEQLYTYVCVL